MNTVKVVLIGDGAAGKTALCIAYACKRFPTAYIPTVFDSWAETFMVEKEPWTFGLFDTRGPPEYDHLRPLSYPQTDVFVVCFSVGMLSSFENIRQKWFHEVHHFCPDVPCVLVATQIDLRSDEKVVMQMARRGQTPVTTAQGERLAYEMGAAQYLECSAKTLKGVQNVFDQAVATAVPHALRWQRKFRRKCIVL
ncbi:Cell division control protein 42 [Mycena sanguinolenta]|uniref:Cell division control protein 42 n=1 Tax=Mycena sanguinolenta TaxID=230812 RepID=A0A8H6XPU5_9AGAR|nr:Cell division control protein 42 [Mycena sanguinolenta]